MKILLVGEYSRLHNSLKEGLVALGHEVLLIGTGDYFKSYPVDINIDANLFKHNEILNLFRRVFNRITKIDLALTETAIRYFFKMHKFRGFDVVQFINSDAIKTHLFLQKYFISKLKKNNSKLFLSACGDDHHVIMSLLNDNLFEYHVLTPYLKDKQLKKYFSSTLRYSSIRYSKLYDFIFNNVNGIIASDLDYHIPLSGSKKYLGLIPNPVNVDKIKFQENLPKNKIVIFYGYNGHSYLKKGSHYILEAIEVIKKRYFDKIEIKIVENLPYNEYIEAYNVCHIFLDQVYSYDQGYNALEAMSKGKVVLTGAEKEWLIYYNLKPDTVAINAEPDTRKIVKKLEWLIEHPEKINEISKNARAFIEKEHHYKECAKKYVNTWEKSNI